MRGIVMSIVCKFCGFDKTVKSGFVNGIQRYKCKNCRANFVEGDKRQKYTTSDHLKVIKLYLENCGIRSIERLTGIRNSQISKWIEGIASHVKEELLKAQNSIGSIKDIAIVEIDELCTYIKKDPKMAENIPSYGLLLIEGRIKLLILK
jgi:transposase-like protein